jgi:hypothetical protein
MVAVTAVTDLVVLAALTLAVVVVAVATHKVVLAEMADPA